MNELVNSISELQIMRAKVDMRWSDWLFAKRVNPGQQGKKRYEYPTCNLETVMRVQRGEDFMK